MGIFIMSYWLLALGILGVFLAGLGLGLWLRTSAERKKKRDEVARRKWQKAMQDALPKEGDWSYKRPYMTD